MRLSVEIALTPTPTLPLSGQGDRMWVVIPAKRARLRRARASREPVISAGECPHRCGILDSGSRSPGKARVARPE